MSIRRAWFLVPLVVLFSSAPLAAQAPSAIEVALAEFRCHVSDTLSAVTDAQRDCLDAQIGGLRADFGRDLSKLSAANRKSMDEACARFAGAEHRPAYLLCVNDQLTALHNRQAGAGAIASSAALSPPLATTTPAMTKPADEPSRVPMMIGAALGMGVLGAGGFFFVAKSRRVRQTCRVCGVDVHDTDLCTKCRHEAAAAARHLPAESPAAHAHERPHPHAPPPEHAPAFVAPPAPVPVVPVIAIPVAHEPPVVAPDVRSAAEEKTDDAEEVFDPYTVLGVSFEAGREKIRAAYEESKAKYDPELVSYLGDEAQARYRLKSDEVERAYQILTGARMN